MSDSDQDGFIGPKTLSVLNRLVNTADDSQWPKFTDEGEIEHQVIASDFADPADLAEYKRAKAEGKSEQEALAVGDNCVGRWGDFTGDPDGVPMCALPPEEWEQFGSSARGKKLSVTHKSVTVIGELRDTMPKLEDIKNGAGIDLNPAFLKQFGLNSPIMEPVTWKWA